MVDTKSLQVLGGHSMCEYSLDTSSTKGPRDPFARTGAVAVMVAILIVVLLGCAAFAVDIGHLYVARTELQRAADSAALAGASGLARAQANPLGEYLVANDIYSRAEAYALANNCVLQGVALDRNTDIKVGYLADPHDLNATLQILPLDQCNAVQIVAHRSTSNAAGKVPLFFAPIWGLNSSQVSASAVAVLDDRFYAYRGANGVPFTLSVDTWEDEAVNGNGDDNYGYDPQTGDISNSPDGVPEVKLFPNREGPGGGKGGKGKNDDGDDYNDGAGNFGILEIGEGGNGVPPIREQIRNGISQDDFVDLTGEPMVKFYDYDSGDDVSYYITGEPGVKAGIKDSIEEKVGQVIGFFLHDSVSGTGANTSFHVVGMRFGRVVKVDLTGNANTGKAIIIQPVPFYGSGVLTSPNAPSTDNLIANLQLVR